LEQYPDVERHGANPLYHYITQGRKEGRMPCPLPTTEDNELQREVDKQFINYSTRKQDLYNSGHYRTVAFYLPQFHPIPENDEWWGDGFTEWHNVKPAKPLFEEHYQPHAPAELGHYLLTDSLILKRQALLAQNYGVDAFCFYFYWFNGKTLLEKPLSLLLNDQTIEQTFCLCWANENWTRRWDGKESDILIAQTYSEDDDINFIEYIAKYLVDPRYLRIEGKAVLLIYRPSLLPDPVETTERWRRWCRENGVGELHLVYTQSFECEHPTVYGCDAATEFAPNIPIGHHGVTPECITEKITGLNSDFAGKVFDWTGYVKRSEQLPHPGYLIYRCLNPGWDNTARKKLNGTVFINSSPRGFQKWGLNALNDTEFAQGSNGLLFINAWNEWAEGAHLEPDQRYGYGYLEALRFSRVRFKAIQSAKTPPSSAMPNASEIAMITHAFYPEILEEILNYWSTLPSLRGIWFIVTTPHEKVSECESVLNRLNPDCRWLVVACENRGRDILPFFKIYDLAMSLGVRIFCKLHTKRSKHRGDGDAWRKELYSGLLNSEQLDSVLSALHQNSGVGIILPREHILPMTEFFGSNSETVCRLAARIGLPVCRLNELPLVAGSMFWARIEALIPMHMLIEEAFFERERGQVDGTFAHAMERMFSVSADSVGLLVHDTHLNSYSRESYLQYKFASKG
jgi:lipopolysaccharide biosynthesis protein